MIIALLVAFFLNPLWAGMGLFLYYLLIGFGLSRFVTASFTNGVFDKYINSRMEGVETDRGLFKGDPDDEADDDDESADDAQKQ